MNLLETLKESDQDFEWYPTTNEIIDVVKNNLYQTYKDYHQNVKSYSLLDCGAGDGRVLNKLGNGDCFAIEKSLILINEMDKDTFIIGTDFKETTLIDKEVDVLFCNPPYLEYAEWSSKIIQEANTKHIYLVIPERWKENNLISNALKLRGLETNVIGSFDFLDGERKARAKVDVIHINLVNRYSANLKSDPFDVWFDANFKIDETNPNIKEDEIKEKIDNQLVAGNSIVNILVDLYTNEMNVLNDNFNGVCNLNSSILKELNVDVNNIKESLKQRIKGLKNKYWRELFKNYNVVNSKLTTKSLEILMEKLYNQTSVDFTVSNALAITGWVIKNANMYFDSQLIDSVENIATECNIKNYKSNNRVFKNEDWRYSRYEFMNSLSDYGLELRCIMENQGGIHCGQFSSWDYDNGMGKRGATTINDLIVIANNLGFKCDDRIDTMLDWSQNTNQDVMTVDGKILMNVKGFKNGNLHIKFNQKFIKKLNVEFGRLKGWLSNKEQAKTEFDLTDSEANNMFYSNVRIGNNDIKLLSQSNE